MLPREITGRTRVAAAAGIAVLIPLLGIPYLYVISLAGDDAVVPIAPLSVVLLGAGAWLFFRLYRKPVSAEEWAVSVAEAKGSSLTSQRRMGLGVYLLHLQGFTFLTALAAFPFWGLIPLIVGTLWSWRVNSARAKTIGARPSMAKAASVSLAVAGLVFQLSGLPTRLGISSDALFEWIGIGLVATFGVAIINHLPLLQNKIIPRL